ncbi:MAG TPA: transglycosylase SLT domain-containing protein [Steroidobacteraceae bacterium]|nr:transglycosylase SLT domain-containing protein [Steroidobacteraceae bacterium]
MRRSTRFGLALCLLAACAQAGADIFAYTDESGSTHYSNVPTDPRFTLLLKSPVEPEAASAAVAPAPEHWRQRAASYQSLIDRTAKRNALQPALLKAVIAIESAFNPHAVSRAGAQGLMQLHPKTARRYGVGNAFDPEQNVAAGAHYLRDLLRRYNNNLELALAAYNAGEDAVDRYGQQIPPYRETRGYVPAVLRLYHELLTAST